MPTTVIIPAPNFQLQAAYLMQDEHIDEAAESAFQDALEQVRPAMRRSAAAVLRRADDIDDAVQEGLLRLLRFAQGGEIEIASLKGLACTTVRRVALDMLSRKRPLFGDAPVDLPAPDGLAPLDLAHLRGRLREAVDGLADPQRVAFLLVHQEGLSHAEAAQELRLSQEGLRARLYRARCELRTALKDFE